MNREAYSTGKCFHQLFEAQAELRPAQTAVVCGDARLTYAELNARANQLARALRARGAGPETLVAVSVSRSPEMAVAILAVLKAGAAYLPLDPAYPAERLKFMLDDAQVSLLVTESRVASRLPAHNAETVLIDADWPLVSQLSAANVESGVTRDNLAYVIYTSGSTGEPKGVMLTHANLTHYVTALAAELGINSEDVYLHLASIAFSSSRRHLMLPLACGAGVVIASEDERRDPAALFELIKARGVTVMDAVPSFWRVSTQWLAGLGEGRRARLLDNKLRLMLSASEPLLSDIPRTWRRDFKHPARHVHMFGQTETSGIVALNHVADDFGDEVKVVPAGRPIANTQIYLLDSDLNPVADGEPGEIYVGGAGLARGYLNRPELTDEKFVGVRGSGLSAPNAECQEPNAERRTPNAERLCKTGDWARRLPDGSLEVLGRQDFQVKIRGQRVELTEIEALLTGHAGVAACAVAAREDEAGDRRLVAYVVPRGGAKLAAAELRGLLKGKLPDYMLPSAFVELDALPLTPNGKLDRRALPAPGETRAAATADYVAPRGATEELLAAQWAALLKLARVGADDDFFELGGHSLLATQAVARVREAFRVELPLGAIFESPTVAGLARRIDALAHTSSAVSASIKPRAPMKQCPLSFAQQRLWFLDQLEPGNCSYHVRRAVRLTGRLDAEALGRALSTVVARHEVLRTNFVSADGEPAQVVREAANIEMPTDDLSRLDGAKREDEIQRIINAEADRPFDLAADPLLRARLLRLGGEEHVLLLVLHHIVIDGWSMSLLLNELFTSLAVETLDRQPSPLPALPIQYADYAVWQRGRLQGEKLQREIDYWKQQLAGIPATLELPTDRPRPAVPSSVGGEVSRLLPRRLREDLQALGRREGATLFMTLLAAFYALLARHSGQEDLVVGSPIAGRTSVETEGLIGFFVNTLALRGDVSGDPSFLELLGRVREAALGAFAHQEMPIEVLVKELHPERSLSFNPLFQAMFALQNDALPRQGLAGLTFDEVRTAGATAKFDLTLDVFEEEGALRATLEYSADLFDAATAERMLGHFETLLAGVAADPSRRVSELPLLTPAEQQQLLVEWNAHALNEAERVCVHRLIEAQAAAKPDAEAVVSPELRLTYGELNERANRLARHLKRLGVGPEKLVGISVERSPEMIVAVLAVMKAGGAYLPLDPMYPQERLAFMLEDANVGVLLTERRLLAGLPPHAAETVCLDADWPAIARESGENLSDEAAPDDLAYVIYTSGSTGRSKGVMVTHGSLASAYRAWESAYELRALTAHLQMASFSFDVFTGDFVRALCSGAKLVLCPRELLLAPAELHALMRRERVDAAEFVPAVMRQLVAHLAETGADLSFMRLVVVGSDAWYLNEYARVQSFCGEATRLINSYGITETTIDNTYFERRAEEPQSAGDGLVPIGRPLAHTKIYVLDKNLRPVPVGVAGELYIGGPCVARGYLNRPELTAEKFVSVRRSGGGVRGSELSTPNSDPNPERRTPNPERLYKTGDRARYLRDGNIEFLGRADDQVKIRGFRIELGEVEGALSRHPQVRECAAVVREDAPNERRLVAYFVAADGADVSGGGLRAFLKESLPDQMIPSAFVRLDALPLSPNGKVNRRALPAPDLTGRDQEGGYVAPQGVTEETIAGIWQRVLGVERVGAEDNFFALGGHSLLATQIISRVADACGVRLPLRSIFETPTVAGLAAAAAELQAPADDAELAAMLAELEGLSDEEAMELLAADGA